MISGATCANLFASVDQKKAQHASGVLHVNGIVLVHLFNVVSHESLIKRAVSKNMTRGQPSDNLYYILKVKKYFCLVSMSADII